MRGCVCTCMHVCTKQDVGGSTVLSLALVTVAADGVGGHVHAGITIPLERKQALYAVASELDLTLIEERCYHHVHAGITLIEERCSLCTYSAHDHASLGLALTLSLHIIALTTPCPG